MATLQVEKSEYLCTCCNCQKIQQGNYLLAFGVTKEEPAGLQIKLCKRCLGSLRKRLEGV